MQLRKPHHPWLALTLLVLVFASLQGEENRPNHVVLISIDGLRPEFYLDSQWPAPMIQQMAREGAHAKSVRGVFPSVTYPSHTTMVTGALPARHGIYYNRPFEPEGQTGRWNWEYSAISAPTLWNALRQIGLTSASISWPVSVGAPVDWNIPEVWPLATDLDPTDTVRSATTPSGLLREIEEEATGKLSRFNFSGDYFGRDDRTSAAAAYLLEKYRPALLSIHLVATDHFQHTSGRQADMVRRALAAVDRGVGRIVEAAERSGLLARTAFIVTGDHGFVDTHTRVSPNVWLREAGLMQAQQDRGKWRATFHTSGGSAMLHLRDPGDREALSRVRALLSRLPRPTQELFRVVERAELDSIGADPKGLLALAAKPGIIFSSSPTGPVLSPAQGGQHGHFPDFPQIHTGFIGWGVGFRSGSEVPTLGLEDIAPLIAQLLDLAFSAPDGTSPRNLLEIPD